MFTNNAKTYAMSDNFARFFDRCSCIEIMELNFDISLDQGIAHIMQSAAKDILIKHLLISTDESFDEIE